MKLLKILSIFLLCLSSIPENGYAQISIQLEGKLHRGAKWSKKKGVPPCSQNFGICGVKFKITTTVIPQASAPYFPIKVTEPFVENGSHYMLITFETNIPHKTSIFFSKDDDPFIFPSEIAQELGYSSITIIPDDYTFLTDEETPFGMVKVKCEVLD